MCTAPHMDEWPLDAPLMNEFIDQVNEIRYRIADAREIVAEVRPHFSKLLNDKTWLPENFQEPAEDKSGMGARIGMWLLYRSGDGGLAFSALVLPSGIQTPVHDHLAWGLVGLYRGLQEEDVFSRRDDGRNEDRAELEIAETNVLEPGDFYELMPENDIHRVRTISDDTSVSLHLLGNDNGCIWRHRFQPEQSIVTPFKSGWLNVDCREYA